MKFNTIKLLSGIYTRRKAFTGPLTAQIDITNACNNTCLYCWARSPLLKERRADKKWESHTLPKEKVISLVDEMKKMNVKRIHFAGGGEPSVHPDFFEFVNYVKDQGLELEITTNFTLYSEENIKKFVETGVDSITVSFWAANPQTYVKLHPNQSEKIFEKMIRNLKLFSEFKKNQRHKPHIRLLFVISAVNYKEINEMFEFAEKMKVNSVLFQVMDAVPGYTDHLLLNNEQKKHLKSLLIHYKEKINYFKDKGIILWEFDHFIRRITEETSVSGNYDKQIVKEIPCYCGWVFTRITADGNVNFCLKTDEYPLGNIFKDSFSDIWYSKKYNNFRYGRFYKIKEKNKKLRCGIICDNLEDNIRWHQKSKFKFLISSLKNKILR